MFEQSLLESDHRGSMRRRWSTLLSALLQSAILGIMVLVPLFYSEAVPRVIVSSLYCPTTTLHIEVKPDPTSGGGTHSVTTDSQVRAIKVPVNIPQYNVRTSDDTSDPRPVQLSNIGPTSSGNILSLLAGQHNNSAPTLGRPSPPLKHSHLDEGSILVKVQPRYPETAKRARVEGAVELTALISRDGLVENVQIRSGNPLLAPGAAEAVRQWRFRPYILNGVAVEVETSITVNFVLSQN